MFSFLEEIHWKKLGALLLAVAALLAVPAGYQEWRSGRFHPEMLSHAGMVTDQYTTRDTGSAEPATYLRVSFVDRDGSERSFSRKVPDEFWRDHPQGSAVVVFDISSVTDASWIQGAREGETSRMVRLLAGGALVLAAFGVLAYDRFR